MTLHELVGRPHWSFSSLNQLLNICSLQWWFQRILGLEPSHVPANLAAGSVHHRTMDQVYLARKLGTPLALGEALDLYSQDWRRTAREENIRYGRLDAKGVEEQGRGLVEAACRSIDPQERILEVGEVFCVPLVHAGEFLSRPLVGEFDLVVEKEGRPVVVDWKTSAARWAKDKAGKSLQAVSYAYAYGQKHGINPQVRFDVAVKNKTPVFESHCVEQGGEGWVLLGLLAERAERIVRNGLHYPSLDSFACSDCPYASPCRDWCRGETAFGAPPKPSGPQAGDIQ